MVCGDEHPHCLTVRLIYPRITNTMLTNTLRDLEELGIIHREQFNEIPPHVEYSLTEKGKALLPVFFEISKWGEENLD